MSLNPVSMDWFGDCSNGPQVALVICLLCMPSFKGSVGARDGLFRPHAFNVSSAPLFPSLAIHVVTLMTVRRPSGPYHECVHFGKDGFILYADPRVVPALPESAPCLPSEIVMTSLGPTWPNSIGKAFRLLLFSPILLATTLEESLLSSGSLSRSVSVMSTKFWCRIRQRRLCRF